MKKATLLSLVLSLCLVFALSGCTEQSAKPTETPNGTPSDAQADTPSVGATDTSTQAHTHTWEGFSFDETSHRKVCSVCSEESSQESHVYDEQSGTCTVCLFSKNGTEGVMYLPSEDGSYMEVVDYVGTAKRVFIASEYNGLPVRYIANNAFKDKTVSYVYIPDSVTEIDRYAFEGCRVLTSITLPDSLTNIGDYAFQNCSALKSIVLPDSLTSISLDMFEGCTQLLEKEGGITYINDCAVDFDDSVVVVTVREGTKLIAKGAFSGSSKMRAITLPDSVISINEYAFGYCEALQSITLSDSLTDIGDSAFHSCYALQSIALPDSLTSIGKSTFYGCSSLTSITLPDSLTSIGECAFRGCSKLTSITLPDSVTSIGENAFYGCSKLTSITIPDSVTSIGDAAFYWCSLTSVTFEDTKTWYVTKNEDLTEGEIIDVTNPTVNAENFDYHGFYWYKK